MHNISANYSARLNQYLPYQPNTPNTVQTPIIYIYTYISISVHASTITWHANHLQRTYQYMPCHSAQVSINTPPEVTWPGIQPEVTSQIKPGSVKLDPKRPIHAWKGLDKNSEWWSNSNTFRWICLKLVHRMVHHMTKKSLWTKPGNHSNMPLFPFHLGKNQIHG